MKVLHLIRDAADALAWEAALAEPPEAEVRVVLVRGGADAAGRIAGDALRARGITVAELVPGGSGSAGASETGAGLDYDGLMALLEWSDRVVAW